MCCVSNYRSYDPSGNIQKSLEATTNTIGKLCLNALKVSGIAMGTAMGALAGGLAGLAVGGVVGGVVALGGLGALLIAGTLGLQAFVVVDVVTVVAGAGIALTGAALGALMGGAYAGIASYTIMYGNPY